MQGQRGCSEVAFRRLPRPVWYGRGVKRGQAEDMRIPEEWLDSVVYLYPDEASAKANHRVGGSGFVAGVPVSAGGERAHALWLVTNKHVVTGGSSVARINTHQGGFDTVELDERNWHCHPEGDDLAVCPLPINQEIHKIDPIALDAFLTKEILDRLWIGPGDPAFVIGRFSLHEGRTRNMPAVRFGQISQLPVDKIKFEGIQQESILVEIRSLGGYSGSPVFVHIDYEYWRRRLSVFGGKAKPTKGPELGPWLLGVDYSMIPLWDPVCDKGGKELPYEWQVPANSGMMGVIPAWRLQWLLTEYEPVVKVQREIENAVKNRANPPAALPTAQRASLPASDENPTHREDFMRLLGAAVKKPAQED